MRIEQRRSNGTQRSRHSSMPLPSTRRNYIWARSAAISATERTTYDTSSSRCLNRQPVHDAFPPHVVIDQEDLYHHGHPPKIPLLSWHCVP